MLFREGTLRRDWFDILGCCSEVVVVSFRDLVTYCCSRIFDLIQIESRRSFVDLFLINVIFLGSTVRSIHIGIERGQAVGGKH